LVFIIAVIGHVIDEALQYDCRTDSIPKTVYNSRLLECCWSAYESYWFLCWNYIWNRLIDVG